MGKIQEIRESIDNKLDILKIKAMAIEFQVNETMESTIPHIESLKQSYLEILEQVKEKIKNSQEIAADKKQEMCTLIEHAEVQLALGKAEARDTIEEQRKTISRAVAELEAELDVELEEVDRETIVKMVTAAELLDAAMETAALRFESGKNDIDELLTEKKSEIEALIETFKKDLAKKREEAPEKWAQFENELKSGLDKVTGAFKKLLS